MKSILMNARNAKTTPLPLILLPLSLPLLVVIQARKLI